MKRSPSDKWIPVEQGTIDKEYNGYKEKGSSAICYCSCIYKGDTTIWPFGNECRAVQNVSELRSYLTWDEQEQWYKDNFDKNNTKNKINILGLFHDMYDIGDSYHEMWNCWIKIDFYEQIVCLEDEEFYLIGIAPAPWDKDDIFGEGNSCAFVCENYDGTRFWCHGSWEWVKNMRKQGRDIYLEIDNNF